MRDIRDARACAPLRRWRCSPCVCVRNRGALTEMLLQFISVKSRVKRSEGSHFAFKASSSSFLESASVIWICHYFVSSTRFLYFSSGFRASILFLRFPARRARTFSIKIRDRRNFRCCPFCRLLSFRASSPFHHAYAFTRFRGRIYI